MILNICQTSSTPAGRCQSRLEVVCGRRRLQSAGVGWALIGCSAERVLGPSLWSPSSHPFSGASPYSAPLQLWHHSFYQTRCLSAASEQSRWTAVPPPAGVERTSSHAASWTSVAVSVVCSSAAVQSGHRKGEVASQLDRIAASSLLSVCCFWPMEWLNVSLSNFSC